ncbi:hypothetical protein B9J09_05895 [Xylella fastidiosa subsp. pauca]|uniref:hypothetical protein n=1 Tax=Xylella fastidiosa TaxID=2371 RepID=UPI000583F094|nr:hypothetical protein [Xylella fastidiosa]ARO68619.1 hypothetical protein B9J09_05895 [Xylella fastidiosa subsp. pauca]AVI20710.1 hypothetical protein BCV75_05440 [Xylella fastidiosa]AVI22738.1 hypothetical protein BC375_05500 [Xylella fastidiosa]KIA57993.1 hypothetical protein RA12_05390 [Xylella fastidiosa]KXB12069.1 hypothetical protein ADT32_04775 [Xylella fastidiosa]
MSPPMPTEMFMRSMSNSELVNDLAAAQAVERFTPVESELLWRFTALLDAYEHVCEALEQDGDAQ